MRATTFPTWYTSSTLLRRPGQERISDSDVACVRRIEGGLQRAARLHVALALVLAKDATQRVAVPSLFARLYGLTPAEGRLAAALLAGKTPVNMQRRPGFPSLRCGHRCMWCSRRRHAAAAGLVCLFANIPHLHGY
jgi:hypothetical protein